MPMTWDADADAKLFAAVLATSEVKINNGAVAEMMGPDCTAKAIIHRIAKIKDIARSLSDGSSTSTTPTKSPAKRARGKGKAADDDNEAGNPTVKKTKTATPQAKAKARAPAGLKAEPIEGRIVKKEDTPDDSQDGKDESSD
ncbi:hypothetical protein A1O1_06302 [Capronia coronata CBS 617.96]|uniref:Uncharacterized protein n=1 Tax=Capronia coronata CBS 617.96 TaxID=1182541 RepID=W9Y0E3_9EURO|nr:uncharacterized protein A1O1_06302 [Capronia coronata CBS 617.96]EXJ85933.1 hypothetical protein A1O1_06302 [Capronia coronata CBS 617.96]